MNLKPVLFGLGVVVLLTSFADVLHGKTNVIVFLADDLGAAELGCYGNREHRTPNLDRMASEGFRLDTFYAAPLCTTSRMALMTGQYGFRNGYLGMLDKAYVPGPKSPQKDIGWHFISETIDADMSAAQQSNDADPNSVWENLIAIGDGNVVGDF